MVIGRCELSRRRVGAAHDPCQKFAASLKRVRGDWNDSLCASSDKVDCDPAGDDDDDDGKQGPEVSVSPCPPQLQYSVERRLQYIFETHQDLPGLGATARDWAEDQELMDRHAIANGAQIVAPAHNGRVLPWMSWEDLESASTGPNNMSRVRRQLHHGSPGELLSAVHEAPTPARRPVRSIDQRLAVEEERLLSAAVAARSAVRTETAAERRACQQLQRAELLAQAEWPCSLLEKHAEGFVAREPKLQAALDRAEERLFTEEDTLQRLLTRNHADEIAWEQERNLLHQELRELSLRAPPIGAVSALQARLGVEREEWMAELREAGCPVSSFAASASEPRGSPRAGTSSAGDPQVLEDGPEAFRGNTWETPSAAREDLRDLRLEAEVAKQDAERAQSLAQLANEDVAERRRSSVEASARLVRKASGTSCSSEEAGTVVSDALGPLEEAAVSASTPLPFPALVRHAVERAEAEGESLMAIRKSVKSRSHLKDLWSEHREKLLSGT